MSVNPMLTRHRFLYDISRVMSLLTVKFRFSAVELRLPVQPRKTLFSVVVFTESEATPTAWLEPKGQANATGVEYSLPSMKTATGPAVLLWIDTVGDAPWLLH